MKSCTFYLGPALDLSLRTVTIRNISVLPHTTVHNADAGAANDTLTVELADDTRFHFQLVDTRNATGSPTSDPAVFIFDTTESRFPAPSLAHLMSMEDMSSSSSSSST